MLHGLHVRYEPLHKCRSASCADALPLPLLHSPSHNNNNLGKPPLLDAHFASIESKISPIRSNPPANASNAASGYEMYGSADPPLNGHVHRLAVNDQDVSPIADLHQPTTQQRPPARRPTSIFIDAEPRRAYTPPLTSSPIGCTLKAELGAELSRSVHSESFNLAATGEENVLDIRVFFSNGKAVQFPVENGQEAKAADILDLITEHLGIEEDVGRETLAIWLISPLLEVQLKPYHVAFEVRKKWPLFLRRFTTAKEERILFDEPLLVLRRNVHLSIPQEMAVEDEYERLTEVLYLDAKDEYMSGRYLVDLETSAKLAALQMAVEYVTFESFDEAEDLLKEKMTDLVPSYLVSRAKSFHLFGLPMMECKRGCEKQILEEYKNVSETMPNNHERRKAYLNILRKTPFYGAAFYYGTTDRKPSSPLKRLFNGSTTQLEVRIGVSHDLITVVDEHRHELLLTRRILDCSWFKTQEANEDEDIPSFFLHFPDDPALVQLEEDVAAADVTLTAHNANNMAAAHEPSSVTSAPTSDISSARHETQLETSWSDQSAPISRLLQVFTKQAPLIDSMMNVVYEHNLSDYGSAEDMYMAAGSPGSNTDEMISPANSTATDPIRYHAAPKSTTSSRTSLANKSVKSNWSHSSSSSMYSSSKLSKLCLATLDGSGRCVEAHGALRRILQECN